MEEIRRAAITCTGRAVGFGTLAVGCTMVGFAFSASAALRAGAVMMLIMSGILIWKAMYAAHQNPRHTEVWLVLDERSRPDNGPARFVFANILRDVYARFAQGVLSVACGLFLLSVMAMVVGY